MATSLAITSLALVAPSNAIATECYAVTIRAAQGPVPLSKGSRERIVDYDKSTGRVIVYRMGGPYRQSDFGGFSQGCSALGLQ